MTEIDTSRDRIEHLRSIYCADYLHMALLDRAEKAEAARDAAWNDAIEAAAQTCDEYQDWCRVWGESKNAPTAETAATECRDAIRALRKGGDDE